MNTFALPWSVLYSGRLHAAGLKSSTRRLGVEPPQSALIQVSNACKITL
jgi:hypothetical protein